MDCDICTDMVVPVEPNPAEFNITLTTADGQPQDQFGCCAAHLTETIAGYIENGALANATISPV